MPLHNYKQHYFKQQQELQKEKFRKKSSQFAKVTAGDVVLLNKQVLFEILEHRIKINEVKIEDLFLLCKAPNGEEGEQDVETPYGKLKVFFVNSENITKTWILNRNKYPYPKISRVSSKGSHKVDPTKVDMTEQANAALKIEYKN